jgi:hypothetical protein
MEASGVPSILPHLRILIGNALYGDSLTNHITTTGVTIALLMQMSYDVL